MLSKEYIKHKANAPIYEEVPEGCGGITSDIKYLEKGKGKFKVRRRKTQGTIIDTNKYESLTVVCKSDVEFNHYKEEGIIEVPYKMNWLRKLFGIKPKFNAIVRMGM